MFSQIPGSLNIFLLCKFSMHAFNQSLSYDRRMHSADIRGSIAYAKSLAKVGILTPEEEQTITEGLKAVGKEWESGKVCPKKSDITVSILTVKSTVSASTRR